MSRYATIETFTWHDEKFRALPEDARVVFLYLLTCPHGNMIGLFYLPELYAASDLQWELERYRRGIDTLCHALLIAIDGDMMWIKNYLKHNQIKGEKQVTGAAKRLMTLPNTNLIFPFIKNLEKHLSKADFALFKQIYTKPYEYPIDTLCDTPSITGTGTDTGTGTGSGTTQSPEKPDDDDKNVFSEIAKEFSIAFGYPPNQTQVEMLLSFVNDGMAEELVLEAMKRSAQNGAKNPSYTKAILQSWLNKSALTMEDVERIDAVGHQSKGRQSPEERDVPSEFYLPEDSQ